MTKIKALIWLRWNSLMANKNIVVLALFPYVLCVLYKNFLDVRAEGELFITSTCLSMAFVFTSGNMISTSISEEKEKKNLKSLMLAGVSSLEHTLSSLFLPVLFGVASIVIMPFLSESTAALNENYLNYFIVSSVTLLVIILIYLLVAIFSDTQAKSQINSLPIMFIVTLLPMFASANDVLKKINKFSFMNVFNNFFADMDNFNIQKSLLILTAWSIALFFLVLLAFKKNKIKKKTTKSVPILLFNK